MNLEALVTKDYLTAEFAKQNANIDNRFVRLEARIETRFAEQKAEIDSKLNILTILEGFILTAVVLPYLERLIVL